MKSVVIHKGFFGSVYIPPFVPGNNAVVSHNWDWWNKQVPELYNIPTETLGDLLDQIHDCTTKKDETPAEAYDRAMRGIGEK